MSFWSAETLAKKLPELKLIAPYDQNAIDCAAYTLHMGREVYVTPNHGGDNDGHTKRNLVESECFTIPPGQFAFLSTKETVAVPDDAIAFLSIKARTKFRGLINISGFHVDPGYRGTLLFSVLNAGPKPLHLQRGDALFLIWYADLDGRTENKKREQGFCGIDTTLLNGISGEILSLQSLLAKQRELEKDLAEQKRASNIVLAVLTVPVVTLFLAWLWETLQSLPGSSAL